MVEKLFKRIVLIFSLLFLLVIIPQAFAVSNDTVELVQEDQSDVLAGSNDYYFNASVAEDGDGSQDLPHKDLINNVKANSINHMSEGEYSLDDNFIISDVSFIGESSEKTIIRYQGSVLNNTRNLAFKNVTLIDFSIINRGTLNGENAVFKYGFAYPLDDYGNSRGGAIYTPYDQYKSFSVTLTNCTFIDNYAEYGGAIYMDGGELNIVNSQFINNTAYRYGGAIACEYATKLCINKTRFVNSRSISDAGGAIYLKEADFNANRIDIINSTSTFGGAITALNTDLTLARVNFHDNHAAYDGGAIYQLYGALTIQQSNFINNSARNGGALLINNLTSFFIINNLFGNNSADCGGAIYSVSNSKMKFLNKYEANHALIGNDLHEVDSFDIFQIGNGEYAIYINNGTWNGSIPEKFNLKDFGYVSSVKDQLYGGNCWAFASLAALESCILKACGREFDLSEENMKNLIELYSDYGWAMDTNDGGYNNMAIGYLTGWLGPVNEINDTYDDYSTLSPLLNSIMHVQNVLFLKRDNYTDNDAIKKAIMKYGAVATGICYYPEYLRGDSYYCYKLFDYPNHAVSIVGWDDTYSRDNFWGSPEVDGAWIVKNSWGESWGDDGYFYVSYCDRKLAQVGVSESAYTFILNDSMRYDKNYQYDVIGKTNYFSGNDGEIYYQNIFKSTGDEILAAVSTYFEKMSNWDLSIYVNDALKLIQSGISDAGYYTLRLNDLIPLKEGDSFKIIFKISGNATFRVPISEVSYSNKFLSREGLSYFSYDGSSWFDLYASSAPSVASIKAFTLADKLITEMTLNVSDNQLNPVRIIANVVDEYGNPVKSGNITFKIEDRDYFCFVENGVCELYCNFTRGGLSNISAAFNGDIYNSSSASALVNVNVTRTFIIADELVSYFGGSKAYAVKLVDECNSPLSGKLISFDVNGTCYENVTDDNGRAWININLGIGEFKLDVCFNGDSRYVKSNNNSKIILQSTIMLKNLTKFTYNSKYSFKLLDIDGNPLQNKLVNVLINSKSRNLTTDENGEATLIINQKQGSYAIEISNPTNDEAKRININVVARITGNKNINMYFGAKKSYKIRIFDDNGNSAKSGAVVKIKIGSKTYSKSTDKNGYATLPISLKAGKYTITAEYKGFKVSNKLVIKSTLTAKDKTAKKGKTVKFTAKLVNVNGKALKGKKILFKIKNKKYSAKTDKKGIATISIKNLNKGRHTITSSYGKIKINNKITVK